ncbi:hypothetical protein [Polyangium fumosum]|nr:hypothetical protein [Polyangium fumosum]
MRGTHANPRSIPFVFCLDIAYKCLGECHYVGFYVAINSIM